MNNNTGLTLFPQVELPQARFSILRLHPNEPHYYVVDERITAYVRLFGAQGARPYSFVQACQEAEQRNVLAGFPVGTYELCIRQATDPLFRDKLAVPWEIEEALARKNADLYYSLSGGKDSDAMIVQLERLHRRRKKHRRNRKHRWQGRRIIVHADTGRTEWSVTQSYVQKRAWMLRLPLRVISRPQGDLLDEMWERHRKRPDVPPFPSVEWRWCTSDQKTNQIHKIIRKMTPVGIAVCAIGIRAKESPKRAKEPIWSIREPAGCRTRLVYDWHPLFFFSEEAVWRTLGVSMEQLNALRDAVRSARENMQDEFTVINNAKWRYHVSYPLGTKRMSCACCFLAKKEDVKIGAYYHPETYRSIVELEIVSGFSYFQDGTWLGSLCPQLLTENQKQGLALVMALKAEKPRQVPKRARGHKVQQDGPTLFDQSEERDHPSDFCG